MTTRVLGVLVATILLATSARAASTQLRFLRDGELVKQVDLEELKKTCQVAAIIIDDPYYRRQKSFVAFSLEEVLGVGFGMAPKDLAREEIFFQASDGYVKPSSGARALEDGGYLAFADADRMKGDDPGWEPIDRRGTDPAPYYVVWARPDQTDAKGYPWPYSVTAIEIVRFERKFPATLPRAAAAGTAAWRGFETFKTRCIACHAINTQGGTIGPDLNVPQGILEYRPREQVKQYIRDPQTFRYSNMPPHKELSDAALDELIAYFSTMQGSKQDPRKSK